MKKSLTVFIPVTNLSGIWKGDFKRLPPNQKFELKVDYPLVLPTYFTIRTGRKGMDLLKLFNEIGKAYETIYNNAERYGVRNHDIEDLSLEGIDVDYKKKTITLAIGS